MSLPPSSQGTSGDPHRLIDDRELAALLGIAGRTPAQWRYTGKFKSELPYLKIGHLIRYRHSDVLSFLDTCLVNRPEDNF